MISCLGTSVLQLNLRVEKFFLSVLHCRESAGLFIVLSWLLILLFSSSSLRLVATARHELLCPELVTGIPMQLCGSLADTSCPPLESRAASSSLIVTLQPSPPPLIFASYFLHFSSPFFCLFSAVPDKHCLLSWHL